jgi:hypothetical protein
MDREAHKDMLDLRALAAIVARLERSSFASQLKEIPNLTHRQVRELVDIEHVEDHSRSRSSASEVATRFKSLAIEFSNELNPRSTQNTASSQVKAHCTSLVLAQFT